jgi:hypothetical protein
MEVSAKTKAKPTPIKVNYALPEKLADLVKAYGEDVVAAAAKGSIVISLQAFMRRHIEKGTAAAALQTAVTAWRPDVRTIVAQSAFEKASGALDKLSPEERKALLGKLQAMK